MDRPVIIIDTREQEPFEFDTESVEVLDKALPTGDYSLAGYENLVCIERKSLPDYVQSVIMQRVRFIKEVNKIFELLHSCNAVEEFVSASEILGYISEPYHSKNSNVFSYKCSVPLGISNSQKVVARTALGVGGKLLLYTR